MSVMNSTAVIGLTGQSGAGKTTVCKVFRDNGFAIIDADCIAHEIMHKGSQCLEEISECFGREIILSCGELDRKKLAEIVFGSDEKLKQLNAICYPYITNKILKNIKRCARNGEHYILLDAPTLFESRADDFCDLIISVTASEKIRSARITERDGLTAEQVRLRFASQHSERYFVNHSDFIIKNNRSVEALIEKAREVSEKVKEYCRNA